MTHVLANSFVHAMVTQSQKEDVTIVLHLLLNLLFLYAEWSASAYSPLEKKFQNEQVSSK